MQGLCTLLNALAEGQAAGAWLGVTGKQGEWGRSLEEMECEAPGRGWNEAGRSQGKGWKHILGAAGLRAGHRTGFVLEEAVEALCCLLGMQHFDGSVAAQGDPTGQARCREVTGLSHLMQRCVTAHCWGLCTQGKAN